MSNKRKTAIRSGNTTGARGTSVAPGSGMDEQAEEVLFSVAMPDQLSNPSKPQEYGDQKSK
jgi:hypothetical protein